MKYLKRFNESISSIDSICREYGITNYTVNPDGTVDVDGGVDLSFKKLTRFPLRFGKVSGYFYCNNNKLTTLEGCPTEVDGYFSCHSNKLTTLEGCPKTVEYFDCSNNRLTIINWDDVYTLNPTSFNLEGNPIFQVYKIFKEDFKIFIDSLEWNYFKKPNIIIKNKFVEACEILSEETGKTIKIPKKIKGYIFE